MVRIFPGSPSHLEWLVGTKTENKTIIVAEPASSLGVVGRIHLTARTVWRRVFREKRNQQISVWPRRATVFVFIAAALIALASQFDGDIAVYFKATRSWFFQFLRVVTDAAKTHYYLIPALLIMTIVSSISWQSRSFSAHKMLVRSYERAAFIFVAIIVPGIFVNIVKQLVGRGRPRTYDEFGAYVFSPFEFTYQFQSFPSGHAAAAGSIGMIIALYVPALRWPALIFAGALAFARVAAGAHYLSDVMAGYLFGAISTLVFARWLASRAIVFSMVTDATFPKLKK